MRSCQPKSTARPTNQPLQTFSYRRCMWAFYEELSAQIGSKISKSADPRPRWDHPRLSMGNIYGSSRCYHTTVPKPKSVQYQSQTAMYNTHVYAVPTRDYTNSTWRVTGPPLDHNMNYMHTAHASPFWVFNHPPLWDKNIIEIQLVWLYLACKNVLKVGLSHGYFNHSCTCITIYTYTKRRGVAVTITIM